MAFGDTLTDTELITLLRRGENKAFAAIYRRYAEPIYLQLRKKVDCREDARDIAQEIFLSLWQKRNSLPEDTRLNAYLFAAARYRAINYMAHHRVSESVMQDLARRLQPTSVPADYLVRERDLSAVIETAISNLPDKMQTVFRMSRHDQLSHKEIARNLNLSETTVKKQVANALKVLKPTIGTTLTGLLAAFFQLF